MQVSNCAFAIFRESARYDPVHLRPYSTINYDTNMANLFADATQGGTTFDRNALASVAPSFLGYQAAPGGVANIANGFDTKRFSFVMKFEDTNSNTSGKTITVLTGYTDHMGATRDQVDIGNISLNPEMHLYFNNLVTLRERPVNTPMGIQMQTNMISARQILFNSGVSEYLSGAQPQFTLRPEDVMQHMSFASDQIMRSAYNEGVVDTSYLLSSATPSSRDNALPAAYLSKTMEKYTSSMQSELGKEDFDDNSVYSGAKQKLREAPLTQNNLFRALLTSSNFTEMGYITVRELTNMYPNMDYVTEVHYNDARAKAGEYHPGQAAGWGAMDNETHIGNTIQQTAPAIMSDCLLGRVSFVATNDVIGGQFDVRVTGYGSFVDGIDITPWLITFRERLISEVLLPASHNGHIILAVRAEIQMDAESRIYISYDGGPETPYVAPVFCDSIYAPVVSYDTNSLEQVSGDIDTMLMNMNGDLHRMAQSAQPITPYPNPGSFGPQDPPIQGGFSDNFKL